MIRIFIGYDSSETVAFHVLAHSIMSRTSEAVSITPITMKMARAAGFTRERGPLESTEFSFTRFMVPYLCGYEGRAIFMDCDMLVLCDIKELWDYGDNNLPVSVVKHEYIPKTERKFLDQPQTPYRMKNWSSVMVFNNALCSPLTMDYINTESGKGTHQFKWLLDESKLMG